MQQVANAGRLAKFQSKSSPPGLPLLSAFNVTVAAFAPPQKVNAMSICDSW
jgi:hypothetical protein